MSMILYNVFGLCAVHRECIMYQIECIVGKYYIIFRTYPRCLQVLLSSSANPIPRQTLLLAEKFFSLFVPLRQAEAGSKEAGAPKIDKRLFSVAGDPHLSILCSYYNMIA